MRSFLLILAIFIVLFGSTKADEVLWQKKIQSAIFTDILAAPDGNIILSKNHKSLYNIEEEEFFCEFENDSLFGYDNIEFSDDSQSIIFSKNDDANIYYHVFDIETEKITDSKIFDLTGTVSFSRTNNKKYLYAFTNDYHFHWWSFETGEKLGNYFSDSLYSGSGFLGDDGKTLLGIQYQRFFIFDLETQEVKFSKKSESIENSFTVKVFSDGITYFLQGTQNHLLCYNTSTSDYKDTIISRTSDIHFSKTGNYAYYFYERLNNFNYVYKIDAVDFHTDSLYFVYGSHLNIVCNDEMESCFYTNYNLFQLDLNTGDLFSTHNLFNPERFHFLNDNQTLFVKRPNQVGYFEVSTGNQLECWYDYYNYFNIASYLGDEYLYHINENEENSYVFDRIESLGSMFDRKIVQPDSNIKQSVIFSNGLKYYCLSNFTADTFQVRDESHNILLSGNGKNPEFTNNGHYFYVEHSDTLIFYSLFDWNPIFYLDTIDLKNCPAFDLSTNLFAAISLTDNINIYNIHSKELVASLPTEVAGYYHKLFFLEDPNYLLEILTGGVIRIWDIGQEEIIYNFEFEATNSITCSEISNNRKFLAVKVRNEMFYMLDLSKIPLSVEDNIINIDISLFPNPSHENISLKSDLPDYEFMNYEITSITGEIALKGRIDSRNEQIDISSLASGAWFLTVQNNKYKTTKKFIKE